MPELPEVQTTVNGLKSKVLNRAFVDVWSDWEKLVKRPKNFAQFKKEIKDKKIIKVYRRAKNIVIDLSDKHSLLIHMKMTGHLLVGKWKLESKKWTPVDKNSALNDSYNKFLHIIFFLDPPSHKASEGQVMLALSDVRKFAKIELWKTKELLSSPEFKNLGPEPLEKSFTFEKFKQAITRKKGKIKQILMIPEVIAGIGNIYASEALWLAKIHPEKNTQNLTSKELNQLYKAIQKVLTLGIDLGGDSFSDYRNVNGEKGKFNEQRKVYKREKEICTRCKKEKIKRIVIATRGSFYCPHCQKLQ